MTGGVAFQEGGISSSHDVGYFPLMGGSAYNNGSSLFLYGKDQPNYPGVAFLRASDGTNYSHIDLYPDGRLYHDGGRVVSVGIWKSGTSWYRKYSDGWVEQGGQVSGYSGISPTVTFPVAMNNTDYYIAITRTSENRGRYDATAVNITKTSVTLKMDNDNGESARWYVCGYWK
jgi:hypothetical protein